MPFCTECRREYDNDVETCPEHGGELVDELPYQTIQGPDGAVWVEIASVGTEDEARFMAGFLETEGIPAQIESLKADEIPTNFGQLGDVRVYVNGANESRAIELLDERERMAEDLKDGEIETDEGPAEIDETSSHVPDPE